MAQKGTLSINTENIFPIIKKFLYSDHDIFLRELVSNAVDACQKMKALSNLGETKSEVGGLKVVVSFDEKEKTITVSDNGIGMTADEIDKYINQIAFSGAAEFVEKYKEKGQADGIIGHFGLGFYSSFMVAKNVIINTLSHQENAKAAKWTCDGSTEFEITGSDKKERGTEITLQLAEDSEEFASKWKIKEILTKYSKFLPVEVEFDGEIINNPNPIWVKQPAELKDEDYKNFYKELYPFEEEPLFWIHLNVDYPFNLTGVLYFPRIKNKFEAPKNKIQLYSRQVFITDEVKDVVPEFLMLLHGVIDSPDIPLNVSRSYLQSDGNVKKINNYITKKVADKLSELFKKDRKEFEDKWDDIGVFVKYGMLTDDKFYEKAEAFCLLKNIENKYFTLNEYKEKVAPIQTDKEGNLIWLYTSDKDAQHTYIATAQKESYDVLEFDTLIDQHFTGLIEQKIEKTQLRRVDADTVDKLISKDLNIESVLTEDEKTKVKETFEKVINNSNMNVSVESISSSQPPVVITMPEFMRRMKEMSMGQGMMMGKLPENYNVTINANHKAISRIIKSKGENKQRLAKQAYDLAMLSQGLLKGQDLSSFIERSVEILAE